MKIFVLGNKTTGWGIMKYGHMTVERSQREKIKIDRVTVNGIDVTKICREADDVEGWVLVFKLKPDDKPYLNRLAMDVEYEKIYGRVRIEVKS